MHVSFVLACLVVGLAATTAEESTMKVNFPDPRPKGSAPPVMDDLSYQVMHTIKGSYTAIGPLQVRTPSITCAARANPVLFEAVLPPRVPRLS